MVRSVVRRFLTWLVWPDARPHHDAGSVVVHEWFIRMGGSDKVAAHLATISGADVVYVFACDRALVERLQVTSPVVTWRLGHQVARLGSLHLLLPLMPLVWMALDLSAARSVVTSAHSCANAVRARDARRISYVHTPMRYAWEWRLERERVRGPLRLLLPAVAAAFRRLDRRWSRQVDVFVANSRFVAGRIREAYGRDADVVPPPVDTDFFTPAADPVNDDAAPFVVAGRFVAYKQSKVAIEAAALAQAPLVMAGSGPDLDQLAGTGPRGITLVPDPPDEVLRDVLRHGRALLMPGIEDFGMLVVEAQACGLPVIARRGGGVLETVIPGVTGELVAGDDPAAWAAALTSFETGRYDRAALRANAERFAVERFHEAMTTLLHGDSRPTP
jgi:glycosyltransferase involved in cell wall biosynthesis